MTALDQDESLVETISKLVLSNDSTASLSHSHDFPLRVKVDPANSQANESLQQLKSFLSGEGLRWTSGQLWLEVTTSDKNTGNLIVSHLLENNWNSSVDYSQFDSHPGMLFVKGFQKSATLVEDLTEYFTKHSRFKLPAEVNVISVPEDTNDANQVAVIVKYDNHLDADHALGHINGTTSFGPKVHGNRYISKKERALLLNDQSSKSHLSLATSAEDSMVYDTIIVENFNDFIAGTLALEQFHSILDKFELFLPVESIFFPTANNDTDRLRFKKVGYIRIVQDRDMNLKLLNALYYFNGLTLEQMLEFSKDDIYDLIQDLNVPESEPSLKAATLKLSIAQRKHNHHLYENFDSPYVGLGDDGKAQVLDSGRKLFESGFMNRFIKSSNYQETNVYVNNLPVIFENNDTLWSEFWNQFGVGRVKSAKIIKPYFYSKKSDGSLGKIGFVFYEEFKMALRAIILTTNKVIKYKNCPSILIQASFAIQKHRSYSQPSGKQSHPKFHHTTPPMNYYPHQEHPNGNSTYIPLPEQLVFNPYMMSMPPYAPGVVPDDRPDEESPDFPRPLEDVGTLSTPIVTSHPPQFGYYYPFYHYSGQMPLAPMPPPMPANGPIPLPMPAQHNQGLERKSSW